MDFKTYQEEAQKTDVIIDKSVDASLIVPLLGLAGEAGQLLSEQKKYLRDGEAHTLYRERVAEELGDLLWYIANLASKFSLDLGEIAEANLTKTRDRFGDRLPLLVHSFDSDFPEHERLPRRFEVEFIPRGRQIELRMNGETIGNQLTDNNRDPDNYRYHDVFHFAHAAVLGWSPITRRMLGRKRRSDAIRDEVEDGGRAAVIEEGIIALVFEYARKHDFLRNVSMVDYTLLRSIKGMTAHLESSACSIGDWQGAILEGYAAWSALVAAQSGTLVVDLDGRSLALKA